MVASDLYEPAVTYTEWSQAPFHKDPKMNINKFKVQLHFRDIGAKIGAGVQ
jgi:hypothetical protein